jgi:uncharacterized protein YbjT (DUF2867 family)
MTEKPIVAVAGATGDLGFRIARALVDRGAEVRALVRPDLAPNELMRLEAIGATTREADPADPAALAAACAGASCVVSALNGLRDVVIDRQRILIDAAVHAGVPRFIPSDYSEDFTKTKPGENRNLDLRREFMRIADERAIAVTSILNGAFMDMLGAEMPIIQKRIRRVLYWRSAAQPLDFTTKDNVAAYTAEVALDATTPRILRIAGDTVSVRQIAAAMTSVTAQEYKPLKAGNIASLGLMIAVAKLLTGKSEDVFPAWQGMQYMRDMFSGDGKLSPLDNDRYPIRWTSVSQHLATVRWLTKLASDRFRPIADTATSG